MAMKIRFLCIETIAVEFSPTTDSVALYSGVCANGQHQSDVRHKVIVSLPGASPVAVAVTCTSCHAGHSAPLCSAGACGGAAKVVGLSTAIARPLQVVLLLAVNELGSEGSPLPAPVDAVSM
jgi:hypothetical protein